MEQAKRKNRFFIYIIIIIGIVLLDYITKTLVINNIIYDDKIPVLGDFLRFTFFYHKSITFGLSNIVISELLYLFIALIMIVLLIVFFIQIKPERHRPKIYISMIIAGIFGNLLNSILGELIYFGTPKLFFGRTVVWIDMGLTESIRIPLFNLADISIAVSTILLIIYIIRHREGYVFIESKKKSK